MKKLLVLFLSMAFLVACSSDDDNDDNQGPDPIVGTWELVEVSGALEPQFCMEEQSTITFNANNTGSATFYLTATECTPTNSTGGWTNNGDSRYTIAVPGVGDTPGTVSFSNDRFTFTTPAGVLTFEKQ